VVAERMHRVHCPSRVLVAVASCARFHAGQAGRGRLRRPLRDWRHAGTEAIPPLRCCRTILPGMARHYKGGRRRCTGPPFAAGTRRLGGGRLRCLFGGWRYACIVAFPSLRCCRQFCRAWLGTTGLADAGALALPLPQARGGWEGRLRCLLRGWCYACIGAFPSLRCCGQFCRAWLGTTGLADGDVLALPLPQTRGRLGGSAHGALGAPMHAPAPPL